MTASDLTEIWVYLSASPLLGLTATMVAYCLAVKLSESFQSHPLMNPVILSIAALVVFLLASGIPYSVYFDGAQYIHFLLGPATVALAFPLYQQIDKLKRLWLPVVVASVIGVMAGAFSAIFIARFLGADIETQLSLAPKSVTAPVAMGIAEQIGGLPSLTAVLAVLTGITGALIGTRLMGLLKIKSDSVKGLSLGVTSHGIGTVRAFQVNDEMGAFAGLGMAAATFIGAIGLPWLVKLI